MPGVAPDIGGGPSRHECLGGRQLHHRIDALDHQLVIAGPAGLTVVPDDGSNSVVVISGGEVAVENTHGQIVASAADSAEGRWNICEPQPVPQQT